MVKARQRGATLVAIDPYRSPTAARCDWHIQPRPGHRRRARPRPDARPLARRPDRRGLPGPRRPPSGAEAAQVGGRSRNTPSTGSPSITGVDPSRRSRTLARLYAAEQAEPDPAQLRPPASSTAAAWPCGPSPAFPPWSGPGRHHGGGALLSTSGTYDFNMEAPDPLRSLAERHPGRQHEPTGRGPRRRAVRPVGPRPVRLQLQSGGRLPRPAAGDRGA